MQNSTFLVIIAFVCLMTGIFTPDAVIQRKLSIKKPKPLVLNGILLFAIFATGFASFFNGMNSNSFERSEHPTAFVFFDQSTNEKVAVYRIAQTNFSNHLLLQIQNRTVVDEESVQLDILLTNNLETPFNFNPDYLHLVNEVGEKITPMSTLIEGEHLTNDFQLEAGESVLGIFLYLKPSEDINFQVKYLPMDS